MDEIKQELDEPGRAAGTRSVAGANVNYRRINDFNYLSGLNLDGQMVLAFCALSCRSNMESFYMSSKVVGRNRNCWQYASGLPAGYRVSAVHADVYFAHKPCPYQPRLALFPPPRALSFGSFSVEKDEIMHSGTLLVSGRHDVGGVTFRLHQP
jgi:hypothetical protein